MFGTTYNKLIAKLLPLTNQPAKWSKACKLADAGEALYLHNTLYFIDPKFKSVGNSFKKKSQKSYFILVIHFLCDLWKTCPNKYLAAFENGRRVYEIWLQKNFGQTVLKTNGHGCCTLYKVPCVNNLGKSHFTIGFTYKEIITFST